MSDGTLVTAAEIARLAHVGRAAVSNWRRRHPDFPEPVVGAGGAPAFRLDEVERWLRKQGKLTQTAPVEAVWRALETDADVLKLVADIAAYVRDGAHEELPRNLRKVVDDLADEVPPEELIESLCARAFERQQRQHLVTPPELARLMVKLAAPVTGTLFDPACGSGTILRAAAEAGAKHLAGQEIDPTLTRLAQARLHLRNPVDIATGDALRADAFDALRADTVVCDPPFGYRDWGHEELGFDPRWEYGFPVKGDPELAWVQHCLAHTKPGGTVVIALPAGVASRRSGRAIRQALLRRGALRAVIALPSGVLMSTGIPIHLWILRNPDTVGADPVFLLDTSHQQPPRRGQVDWDALEHDILDGWREFHTTGTTSEVPGRRRVIEPIELLDEDVDLTPARHLPQPVVELDLAAIERTCEQLERTLGELGGLIPKVRETGRQARAFTTIGDLARAGALVLKHQIGPLETAEDASGPQVLRGRDVITGDEPGERYAGHDQDELVKLRPGDVVVPVVAAGDGALKARVIDENDLVLGPNLQLIRVDESTLDPHFLAGQIRGAGQARAVGATASGVRRVDARRVEIPVLDLEGQRRLGRAFQQLESFSLGLRHAADLGARLAGQLIDGLADGAVEPGE
ncbi:N-6 DNA methylase [Amycolatopsis cynarae]|uniref:N-6 DNA methylase n=1 Tax=Amycolatopsis cynarae TaxID=2995223 RepID=A0ABY7B7P2_9PSEU|nr:N-6 DNA methylase [Amycolatopsis sp. HUAS 11-8]WAL67683.1 N-6 DNA methylase [Amycolatopsis sp. HUAS 11-8]